jgi:hypothetical protein
LFFVFVFVFVFFSLRLKRSSLCWRITFLAAFWNGNWLVICFTVVGSDVLFLTFS